MSSQVAQWMEPDEAHAGEVRKLSTLLEASQALSATLDLHAGLTRVLEILVRHHGSVRGAVVLQNENTGEVELEASAGAIAAGKRVRFKVGEDQERSITKVQALLHSIPCAVADL